MDILKLNQITVDTLNEMDDYGLVHLISLAHPNKELANYARNYEKTLIINHENMESMKNMESIVNYRAKFKQNIQNQKDRCIVLSNGHSISVLSDELYDIMLSDNEEDRKLAFLAVENLGFPENISVIQLLKNALGPDWANKQASKFGFSNAEAVRIFINRYYESIKDTYQTEFNKLGQSEVYHWNRRYLFKQLNQDNGSSCQYELEHVIGSFLKLIDSILCPELYSTFSKLDLFGVPMYLLTIGQNNIILDPFTRDGNKPERGVSFKVKNGLSYASLPFKDNELLSADKISRLFHELGHAVHHAHRTNDNNDHLFEVPSTLMEYLLMNENVAQSIGLLNLDIKPPNAHSILSDITYSMYCLDLFDSDSSEVPPMSDYYNKYFKGYTCGTNHLHTESNLSQIVNYQSTYYQYIISDAYATELAKDWPKNRNNIADFFRTTVLPF